MKKVLSLIFMSLFVLSQTLVPAFASPVKADTKFKHKPLKYVVPDKRITIEATIKDKQGIETVRCYFRAAGEADYVFVPMTAVENTSYTALLPAPAGQTGTIEYLFLTVNGSNQIAKTQVFETDVKPGEEMPKWQQDKSDSPVAVSTEASEAPADLTGFSDSVTMDMTESSARFGATAGLLSVTSSSAGGGAAATGAAAAASTTTVAAGAGISTAVIVGAGAVAVAGTAVGISSASSSSGGDNSSCVELEGSWETTERVDVCPDVTAYQTITVYVTDGKVSSTNTNGDYIDTTTCELIPEYPDESDDLVGLNACATRSEFESVLDPGDTLTEYTTNKIVVEWHGDGVTETWTLVKNNY